MLTLPPSVRIYLFAGPTDMRKGHDGLSAMVRREVGAELFSGHLFVFVSRRGDRVKILAWDRGGLALWYKRLERGRFRLPRIAAASTSVQLDPGELSLLLEGLDYSKVRRPARWEPPSAKTTSQQNADGSGVGGIAG